MINLIYNKHRAIELKADCDKENQNQHKPATNKKEAKKVIKTFLLFVFFVICGIASFFMFAFGDALKHPVGYVFSGVMLLFSIISTVLLGAMFFSVYADFLNNEERCKDREKDCHYPVLVDFYNKIGYKEILRIDFEPAPFGIVLNVTYESEGGIEGAGFYLKCSRSSDVSEVTVDLEKEKVFFPRENKSPNFVIKENYND